MTRVLVIEDEAALQKVLSYNLEGAGYDVSVTGSGAEGIALAEKLRPDLVLLDLMLPDISGTEVCRSLKREARTRDIPICILTARGSETDRIVGFELGAADYVVKPFSVRELLLRIEAVLRRTKPSPVSVHRRIELGCLRIDTEAHRVWVDEVEVTLTLLELRLLVALYENRNRVQSRASLLDSVWGLDVSITTRTVDTHVKRLRDKLGRAGDYVETVRGVGYRLTDSPDRAGGDGA